MSSIAVAIMIGLIGGIAVGFQNPLASLMGQRVGFIESAFIIHLGGTLAAGLVVAFIGGGQLGAWRSVPWYALGAGLLGVIFISSLTFAIPRIGVAGTVSLIVMAQLIIGGILDHYGLLGAPLLSLDVSRVAGMGLLFVGTWLILR